MDAIKDATIEELLQLNPALSYCKIRVDVESQRGSVIDSIRWMTGGTSSNAQTELKRLFKSNPGLEKRCAEIQINGTGRACTVASAPTLIEIIQTHPCDAAKEFRRQSAHLIARYLGADRTLIDEIESRFERVPAEAKAFLQAHTERPEMTPLSDTEAQNILKRKREELEIADIDAKLLEQKAKLLEQKAKVGEYSNTIREQELKSIELEATHKNTLIRIDTDNKTEMALSRTRFVNNPELQSLMQKDSHVQSALTTYVKQSLFFLTYNDDGAEGGGGEEKFDFCPDFATLCREMGFGVVTLSVLSKIGKHVACKFRVAFKKEPEKTEKYVNGGNHMVMTYRLEHLEWLKDRIREVIVK
jgi:hypothetical protein